MATKKTTTKGNPRTGQFAVKHTDVQKIPSKNLTKLEKQARREASQSIRTASFGGSYGFSGGGNGSITHADSSFYSPQLSTDFLELPQSEREKRELFRFWYKCFVPGTPVLISDGTVTPIEDLRVGDALPNGFGRPTMVKNIFSKYIKDNIVEIKVRGVQNAIQATGNHPFLIFKKDIIDCHRHSSTGACKQGDKSFCKRIKCSNKEFGEPKFIYSKDLEVGDYIISPPLNDTVDCGLSKAELRLLGYYVSEGSIAYRSKGVVRGIEFSLNVDEEDTIAKEISILFQEVYGKKARVYLFPERGSLKVVCDGVGFAKFCEKWGGRGSHHKRLREELVKCSSDQALEFLGAYWNGDGCFTDNSYTANTVSTNLASQLHQMLRRLTIPAYNSKYDRPINKFSKTAGVVNYISFPGRYYDIFSKYANFVEGDYQNASSTRTYITHCSYGFLHRIESLNAIPYDGYVYNIEVEGEGDEKSYVAHGLSTHNSHPIVGASIDFHCFPPGAPVVMKDGSIKHIEHLNIDDEILNGFGEPTKVVETFQHNIDSTITRLKVRGIQGVIDCTENHPFLVYRSNKINCKFPKSGIGACKQGTKFLCRQKKCFELDPGSPEFIFAKDLRVGDYICSPSMTSSNSKFNRAQLRLLGYYAAEGSLSRTKYGKLDRVVFSLNIDEFNTVANEIANLFQDEYGHEARKFDQTDTGSCQVRCYKKIFAEFCHEHVGSGSRDKKLSLDIVDSPREDILEFLGAYWNGDGSLTKNGYVATTTSEQLAHQIFALAMKVGFEPRIRSESPKVSDTGFKHSGLVYRIFIPYRFHFEFSKYANFVQDGYSSNSTREYSVKIGNHVLRRIEEVSTIQYCGPVHNIEVHGEGDRKSYVAFGLSTHNTDIPMSKIRLSIPKSKDIKKAKQILHFYEQMCKRIKLFQVLYDATHEYWLQGMVYLFCEDHDMSSEIPEDDLYIDTEEEIAEVDYAGRSERRVQKIKVPIPDKDREKLILDTVKEKYQGWQRIQILPPEQVRLEVFQYTDKTRMELIPSDKDKMVVLRAEQNDDRESRRIADDMPDQIKRNLLEGQPIPLNTSPYDDFLCSSFCYLLSHHKSSYENHGTPILERCHLPGTEITARRGGQILQIPIEDLDPEADEVLGGSGVWRNFDHGTRPVSESVTEIRVEKVLDPIRLTFDHKMGVVRGDIDMDVLASEVLPGDYVQVSQVGLTESVSSVNLADFIRSIAADLYVGRKSGETSSLSMMVIDETEESFTVQYSKTETDPKKASYSDKIESVLDWLSGLTESATISGTKFCERFGFYPSDKTKIRAHLAELGVSSKVVRVGARHLTTFNPLQNRTEVDRSKNVTKVFHKTISLDSDFGYLIGYWLGDGWIRKNSSTLDYGQFGICYSTKSPRSCASADYLKPILDKLGVKWSEINHAAPSNMRKIQGYNDIFTRWLATNFGHTKDDKHLPSWIFDAPQDFLFGLIRGLVDSDGCVTVKKTGVVTVQLAMSTKPLMDQIVLLMQSLGLPPSVHLHKSRDVKMPDGTVTKDCRPLWQAAFSDSEAVSSLMGSGFLAKKVDVRVPENLGWGRKHRIIDGKLHYRVKSVSSFSYEGPVYSMDVDEDHSFYANRIWHANCLRTLLYQDKLRQAQTSIASRAMTPKRVIWADKASIIDVEVIREQVDQALVDPDFTIIANHELHWDEIGSRDRLLDLSNEYEHTNRMLYIGLRITESMLTGESSYSGERIHLDVMNTMYLLYRETLSTFVEEQLFAPVAEKKEFYEEDEHGNKVLLYPKLQFTRLALRDNTELLDFMFNLYQKGSMPISYIYDLLNIDSTDAHEELLKDFLTIKDSSMNEFIRELLSSLGSKFAEDSDASEKIATNLRLKLSGEKGDRFGKS